MIMSPMELRTKNHCAGKGQQQFNSQFSHERVVRQSSASRDMSMEAEEYSLLGAAT
jgi:hypothetical protein